MKFVCLECETYMTFSTVEVVKEGSLGVRFACPTCNKSFSMVTNPGETQMLTSLGVQLGGRKAPATPLEMTRGSLRQGGDAGGSMGEYLADKGSNGAPAVEPIATPAGDKPATAAAQPNADALAASERAKAGGCPFSAMISGMGMGASAPASINSVPSLEWSPEAEARLANAPSFVQGMVRHSAEAYARKQGLARITPEVMDAARAPATDMQWTVEAEARLAKIPDYLRPMLRKEIERLLRDQGVSTVTAKALDQAKDALMSLGAAN